MKKILFLILILVFAMSCVRDVKRIKMECYVYDKNTKKPLNNVKIIQILDGNRTEQAKTSENGYFEIDQSTKLSFGMESHKLGNIYFLEKEGFQIDTLEVYGGVNDVFKKDSILMIPLSIQKK